MNDEQERSDLSEDDLWIIKSLMDHIDHDLPDDRPNSDKEKPDK